MPKTMVNAKVDTYIKERGDEVLRRNNKTNSDAVQKLWEYLAITGDLPGFMRGQTEQEQRLEKRRRLDMLRKVQFASGLSQADYERDDRETLTDALMERYGY
jgi:antitoxin component of RelBE/YafQ-DinJ toxin-antitoxin module